MHCYLCDLVSQTIQSVTFDVYIQKNAIVLLYRYKYLLMVSLQEVPRKPAAHPWGQTPPRLQGPSSIQLQDSLQKMPHLYGSLHSTRKRKESS